MKFNYYKISLTLIGLLLLTNIYADDAIYELPSIGISTELPFLYTQSSQLGNQIIISDSQIIRSGANNIGQLINNIAGVQYFSGLAAEPQILIHSEPAMILVNGQALTNFSMSNPDINLIPLSEIQKIIITPAVAGTTYGNQSLGGVINIITKAPTQAENSISLAAGDPWMNQVTAVSAGQGDDANTFYRLNFQNQFQNGYRYYNQQDLTNVGFNLLHNYNNGALALDMYGLRQSLQFPGYLTQTQAQQNPRQSLATQGEGTYLGNTGLVSLTWTQNLNALWQSKTNLSFRAQGATPNFGTSYDQNYTTTSLNPELDGQFQAFNRNISTTAGVMLSQETYNFTSAPPPYFNINGANQQQYNAYGSLGIPLTKSLTLSASGRVVDIETKGQFFNNSFANPALLPGSSQSQSLALATVGLNDQLNKETSIYVRRAMGYQLPQIDQSSQTINVNSGFGLQPTTSTSYETGINWQGKKVQLDAEAFLINLDNEISFVTLNNYSANYNLPPTRREGVSIDGSFEPNNLWTLSTSLTLMKNYFREGPFEGNEIPGASDVLADINARYQITKVWSIYGETQYTGPQFAPSDNYNVAGQVPGYWLVNAALNAEFSNWLVSLRLDNITNQNYNITTVYSTYSGISYYPAPGRSAVLSLTYRFQ